MLADILHKVAEFESEDAYDYRPRPSLAGPERCIRQLDYMAQKFPRSPWPGRFITVLDDSSWHEQLIKDWIRKSAFQLHSEQMAVECGSGVTYKLFGKIDGIITDVLGVDRLLEIKAISHFAFQEVWAGELPMDYIAQTFLYLRGVNKISPLITEALLFIKNKNQAQYLEIRLRWYPETDEGKIMEMVLSTAEKRELNIHLSRATESSIEKFNDVESYKASKKLHDRQYARDHWRCEYCGWGSLCWKDYEEEFEQKKKAIELPEEFSDTCRYYCELGMQLKDMEKERDGLKATIKAELNKFDARGATSGEYEILYDLRHKKKVDQALIPPAILKQATSIEPFEVLTVRRRKP